jgi:hypothetical protein
MKETPADKSLEERLAPPASPARLPRHRSPPRGRNQSPPTSIALRELDVPGSRLLAALRDAFDKARGALGGEVDIRPGLTAVAHESMGRIPSPFQGDGVFEKGDVVLTDSATGEQLVLTALGLSMIEKHHFFQGRGSRYRNEPARAARLRLIPSPPPV